MIKEIKCITIKKKIELLEGTDENAVTVLSQQDNSITDAKLLIKVERYDRTQRRVRTGNK